MHQVRAIEQIQAMARRAFVRDAGRDAHHLPPRSEAEQVFQQEYDHQEMRHSRLRVLLPETGRGGGNPP